MKHSKDPFEAAIEEEQDESPPESPVGGDGSEEVRTEIDQTPEEDERSVDVRCTQKKPKTTVVAETKNKDEDEEEEEENMEVELTKFPTSSDPAKMAKMQNMLSQFTEDQMSRYESFRRSALHRPQMKKLLIGVTGSQKISMPMIIVVCGIAKMFVGELVETGVCSGSMKVHRSLSPLHAEVEAVIGVAEVLAECQIQEVEILTDCDTVYSILQYPEEWPAFIPYQEEFQRLQSHYRLSQDI